MLPHAQPAHPEAASGSRHPTPASHADGQDEHARGEGGRERPSEAAGEEGAAEGGASRCEGESWISVRCSSGLATGCCQRY